MFMDTGFIDQEQQENIMDTVCVIQTLRTWACFSTLFIGSVAGHIQSVQSLRTVR